MWLFTGVLNAGVLLEEIEGEGPSWLRCCAALLAVIVHHKYSI